MAKKKKLTKKKKLAEAQKHYDEGEKYAREGVADSAIECWLKTTELNPDHFDAWYNLGNVLYMEKGNWEKAFACWGRALQIKPDDIDVMYNIANT
ncbi:MAG: tetratricopeptide repeat protein, partial [Candidatus Heimdallarchaeota archaeon]